MDIVVAVNGYGNWDKYTLPCIFSVEEYEPDTRLVVVDNNSTPPYPTIFTKAQIIRTPKMSYAEMMNFIPRMFEADWYLILNNDVICTAPFLHRFEQFDKNTNYGCKMLQDDLGRKFIETWMIIFSHESWKKIGPWDEKFEACGFEDADWGFRAAQVGVNQEKIKFPFLHGGGSRFDEAVYSAQRLKNMRYLIEKWGGNARTTEV